MIVEIMLGIFVLLFITTAYAVWNLLIKQEQLEDWIEDYIEKIIDVNKNLRDIDYKGYFEVDDEVGQIFKQIKEEVNSLEELTDSIDNTDDEGIIDATKS